jgi:broad specificity phosphatase PhoE
LKGVVMFNFDPAHQLIGFLIRHGELTDMHVWDGWGELQLSEKGCDQAESAARWLSFERIGRVISSDVPRTMQTAQYLMNTGCVSCPFLGTDPNLRPWMVADFTGKEKTPERLAAFQKYLDNPKLVIPGGESHEQLEQRVQVIFQLLATPYNALPSAFFIHNSVIKAVMGIPNVREACSPGGIVGVYLDEKGEMSFEVLLGKIEPEIGVS